MKCATKTVEFEAVQIREVGVPLAGTNDPHRPAFVNPDAGRVPIVLDYDKVTVPEGPDSETPIPSDATQEVIRQLRERNAYARRKASALAENNARRLAASILLSAGTAVKEGDYFTAEELIISAEVFSFLCEAK